MLAVVCKALAKGERPCWNTWASVYVGVSSVRVDMQSAQPAAPALLAYARQAYVDMARALRTAAAAEEERVWVEKALGLMADRLTKAVPFFNEL